MSDGEENEEAFATELNEEAIEAAVDQVADHIQNNTWYEDKAMDVGIDLPDLIKRVSVELEARGS